MVLERLRTERRQYINGLRRELATFKEELRYNADKPTLFTFDDLTVIPESARYVSESLKKNAVDIWHEFSPEHRDFVRILKEFQVALYSYSNVASNLQQGRI